MRWWFCTASSPRSSTSNPKAAVLRRHRPKNGGTGISRFRRFCLIAVATPSRADPDTGRARPPAAAPPIRRCPAAPLPRCPVAPSPRRPAAPSPRRPAAARVRIQTSRSSSAPAESAAFGVAFAEKTEQFRSFRRLFSSGLCYLIKFFRYCNPDMREADRRTLQFRRTIRRPAHISDTYDIPAHGTARAPAGISHDGVPPFINQSLYHYETFITRSADPPSQRWRQSPAPTTRKP